MDTQKLTYGGMLSAVMVAMTIIAMMTGVGYTLFLDLGIPIMIGLIYLKCDFKYTVLCSVISVWMVLFGVGDLPTGIWMIQGIVIGFICSTLTARDTTVLDDLLWCSVGGSFIVVFIDIYCEAILGMSIMKELWHTINTFPANKGLKEAAFYIGMASLPVGTSIVAYVGTLLLASRLHLLKGHSKEKFKVIRSVRQCASYMCCSSRTTNISILYLLMVQLLQGLELPLYIKTVVYSIQWIVLYFIIRDAYAFISKYIYTKTKSVMLTKMIGIGALFLLIKKFKFTVIVLTGVGYVIDKAYCLRDKQIKVLKVQIAHT